MDRPADYSVLIEDRLIAYLWRADSGRLRRAGAKGETPLAEVAFAEILLFDAGRIELIKEVVTASTDFDALLFKLGLESFDVRPGEMAPDVRCRRF